MAPMRELQQTIVDEFGVKPEIDPAAEVDSRVGFLADYLASARAKGYVLGISGGVDSTLGGRLAQLAVERVRANGGEATFVAMRLPYKVQHDEADAAAAIATTLPSRTSRTPQRASASSIPPTCPRTRSSTPSSR